jgi:predicted Zn finger-like uncharacterized protein
MSFITRCPACATQFKVAPDQLKLSDGWVRCGHCSDVFDANRYLENRAHGANQPKSPSNHRAPPPLSHEPATPREEAAPSSQTAQAEMAFPLSPQGSSATLGADALDVSLTLDETDPTLDTDQTQPRELGVLIPVPRLDQSTIEQVDRGTEETSDFRNELQRFAATQGKPPKGDRAVVLAGLAARPPASTSTAIAAVQQIEADVAQPLDDPQGVAIALEPGFVRQARRRAFWRSPGVRALLTVAVLLLSALLAAQWALQERDRLAARYPDFQPLLVSLCEPLDCTIGAVRDLQAVVIDSATLTRKPDNFYSFDLVLKNTSATALAVPALELSLTDTADAVISRRVFLPDELPGVPPLLPPQSTVSVSLRLSLPVGSELPMTGYRALVFYP